MSNSQNRFNQVGRAAGSEPLQGEVNQELLAAFNERSDDSQASEGGEVRGRLRINEDGTQPYHAGCDEDDDENYNDEYDEGENDGVTGYEEEDGGGICYDEDEEDRDGDYEVEDDEGVFYDENGAGWTERPETYLENSHIHLATPPEAQWMIDEPTLQAFERNLVLWRPPFLSTIPRPYQRPRKQRGAAYAHVRDFSHSASKLSVMQMAGPHWKYPSDPDALEYEDPAHIEEWWAPSGPAADARSAQELASSLDNTSLEGAGSYESEDLIALGYRLEQDTSSVSSPQVNGRIGPTTTPASSSQKLDLNGNNVLFAPDITQNFQLKDSRGPLLAKLPLIYSTPSGAKLSEGYAFWRYLALPDFVGQQVDNVSDFVPVEDIEAASMPPGYELDRQKKFGYEELEDTVRSFANRKGTGVGYSWTAFEPMWFSDASAIFWDILPEIRPYDRIFWGVHETRDMNVVVLMKFDFIQKGLYLRLLKENGVGNGEVDAAGLPVLL